MNLCRACLSADKELYQSDDTFACNYNLLTNINVKFSDGKSQCFCQTCIEAVNCFIDFRNKCLSAESTLQGLEQPVKLETKTIKVEVKFEKEDYVPDTYFGDQRDYTEDPAYTIKEEKCTDVKEKRPSRQRSKKKIKSAKQKKRGSIPGTYVKLTNSNPTCGLCSKEFEGAASLSKHVEDHELEKGCQLCPTKFKHRAELFAHRMLHTAYHQNCHLCSIRFRSHANLEFHYRKIHYGEKNVTLECSICPKRFNTPRRLAKHVWSNHSDNEYVCDICSKKFNNKQKLKSHVIGHGDARPYVCDLCGYCSKYAAGLAAHNVRRHAPSKRICKECGNAFADAERLARHTCHDTSQICPVCGKSVRRGLIRHMRTHTEERNYKCDRCPATYKSRSALREHGDKHDNNPRQECEYCHARFYSGSVLVKHRRVHTGEKPYACTKCDMRFTGRHNLKVHMKVHGENLVVKRNQEAV